MKKITIILLLLCFIVMQGLATTYTTVYPTHDTDHVKATTYINANHYPWFSTDPGKSLTGDASGGQWFSGWGINSNQRFHIDLGSAVIIRRIYYENDHNSGGVGTTEGGVQNFIFQGSNTSSGTFDDLVYANDGGWTTLTVSTNVMLEHITSDEADPHYITVTNATAYQYYAFKFTDNWTRESLIGIRHIELQTEDGYGEAEDNAIFFGFSF